MTSVDEMRKKYFTDDGQKALTKRLQNLIKLYEQGITYPFLTKMYGFIDLTIQSDEGHLSHINELRQILGLPYINLRVSDEYGRTQQITVK